MPTRSHAPVTGQIRDVPKTTAAIKMRKKKDFRLGCHFLAKSFVASFASFDSLDSLDSFCSFGSYCLFKSRVSFDPEMSA
jgi:CxxC motif-containing protein (DUF1111 family)